MTPEAKPISLVFIDDNRLLREGIAAMIQTQPGFKVLASSADADEALTKVREANPDVVLLDFGLEDSDSLNLTATVHREVPTARVIVMGLGAHGQESRAQCPGETGAPEPVGSGGLYPRGQRAEAFEP